MPFEELDDVQAVLGEVASELGDRGRVLLRYSGTENKCRVLVEGEPGLPVDELASRIAAAIVRPQPPRGSRPPAARWPANWRN